MIKNDQRLTGGAPMDAGAAERLRQHMAPHAYVHMQDGLPVYGVYIPGFGLKADDRRGVLKNHLGMDLPKDLGQEHFNLGRGVAAVDRKVPLHVLAHELGHASLRKTPLSTLLWASGGIGSGLASPVGQLMASGDPDGKASKAAPWVAAALNTPQLLDEAISSYRGYRALKQLGVNTAGSAKSMGLALGIYGTNAAANIAMPLVQRKLLQMAKRHAESQKKKVSR